MAAARTPATWLLAALLVAVTIAAYSTSFRGVFVYDDGVAIVENPNIKSLWPLTSAMSAPAESPVSARPVAALTLAVNYAVAPKDVRDVMAPDPTAGERGDERFLRNVWGYHAVNLALHIAAALAIAGIVRRTLEMPVLRDRFGRAAPVLAFAIATVWSVHPLTTDAVTYVAQRTEVLMGLFYALTVYCCAKSGSGLITRSKSGPTPIFWYGAAIAFCALGMASKQTMVTAPLVVVAWDWIFLGGLRRWRLYAGLASTWLLLGALVAYERWPTSIGFALEGWTPWTYLLTQTTVIPHYAWLSIAGGPLALDYDGWPMSRSAVDVLRYALPLLALFIVTVAGLVRRRAWAFPLVVWFAALAPSSSFLPLATEIAAERRVYLPLAAFISLAGVSLYSAGNRWLPGVGNRRTRQVAGAAAVTVAIATYGWMTFERNRDFWSVERIWHDTVQKQPKNSRARLNYGVALAEIGRGADAEGQLREAVRLKHTNAAAHLNLGSLLASRGRPDEGIAHLERAIALDPTYTAAYRNLGEAYGAVGNRAQAAAHFSRALERAPDDAFLLNRVGWLLATSPEDSVRNGARAVSVGERAVQLTSRQDPTSLDTLAVAYAEVDRFGDAVRVIREALAAAERLGRPELLPELRQRLAHYEAGRKYRQQ